MVAKKENKSNILSTHIATLRITFGMVWAIDAFFKWRPSFMGSFIDQINSSAQNLPSWLTPWYRFWSHLFAHNPHFFTVFVAVIESLIAIALLTGFARRATYLSGTIFSLLIWSVAEGFSGPYSGSSSDFGVGIIYAIMFLALYGLDRITAKSDYSVDDYLCKKVRWWNFVANP